MVIDEAIIRYVENNSSQPSALLKQVERETHLYTTMPHMVSGHIQGRFLAMVCALLRPQKILEIGTFTGYATLCMAEHLLHTAQIITIDINEESEDRVRGYFRKSGWEDQIKYIIGDALEILPGMQENFDLVFIDADKPNYLNYYKIIKEKVLSGGLILVDNVLWDGEVAKQNINKPDKNLKAILEFNSFVNKDVDVEVLILPIRDGLMMIRKK